MNSIKPRYFDYDPEINDEFYNSQNNLESNLMNRKTINQVILSHTISFHIKNKRNAGLTVVITNNNSNSSPTSNKSNLYARRKIKGEAPPKIIIP